MRTATAWIRATLAVVAATAGLAALPVVVPAIAQGSALGGLSVRPAHFDASNPATRAYFRRVVARGHTFSDAVVVTNTANSALSLYAYPVDGLTGTTSGSVYANRQDLRRKAAKWVRLATTNVSVPAHGTVSLPFSVRVPSGANPGDHLAGIAVENARPVQSGGKFSVTEVIRAVVGVLVTVPGPGEPHLQLQGISLKSLPGTRVASVVVSLADDGAKLCKPKLTVSLGGRTVQRQLDTILPGDRIDFPLPWPRPLGAGTYDATATGSGCGPTTGVHGSPHLGTALAGTTGTADRLSSAPKGGSIPWWPLPLVGIGGALAGTLVTRRGRRPGAGPAR